MSKLLFTLFCLLLIPAGSAVADGERLPYFTSDQGQAWGTLYRAQSEQSAPALILIHEWWGILPDIHNKAKAFANEDREC